MEATMVGTHAVEQLDSPLSFDATLVISEGGLRPPPFLMSPLLGGDCPQLEDSLNKEVAAGHLLK